MDDIFAQFMQLLIGILTGMTISCVLGLYKKPGLEWLIAAICVTMYMIVRCLMPLRLFTNNLVNTLNNIDKVDVNTLNNIDNIDNMDKLNKSNNNNSDPIKVLQVDVKRHGLPEDKFAKYGTTKYPVMGPLDNLTEEEASKRLQYLAGTVNTPYKALSYYNWRTDADSRRDEDKSKLVNTSQLDHYKLDIQNSYPDMTRELTNARDCLSYEPGHPFSCIQEWPEGNRPAAKRYTGSILDIATKKQMEAFTELEEDPINKVVSDEYRRVGTRPIWRNAPGIVARNSTRHGWHDMCRNCKVGRCLNGVCGSRLVEPGNYNIIDAGRLLSENS